MRLDAEIPLRMLGSQAIEGQLTLGTTEDEPKLH